MSVAFATTASALGVDPTRSAAAVFASMRVSAAEFGEECGLIVNGTSLAEGVPQLDCCDGLVCCENDFTNSIQVPCIVPSAATTGAA